MSKPYYSMVCEIPPDPQHPFEAPLFPEIALFRERSELNRRFREAVGKISECDEARDHNGTARAKKELNAVIVAFEKLGDKQFDMRY